ncbi:MAG: glycosyltransferase [Pseudomonadales bacterium]
MRIALLTNILTPYRVPVYRILAESPGLRWRFFTNAATECNRSWQLAPHDLDVEIVKSLSWRKHFSFGGGRGEQFVTSYFPIGLLRALRRFAPNIVVSSELGARTLLALLYCRIFRVPLVIWSYHSRVSAVSGPLVRALRRILLASADAVVGMGCQARRVLTEHGVPEERIFDAPNAHDRDGLVATLATADPTTLQRALAANGCRDQIALVVGRLVLAKGIKPLLDAWDGLPPGIRADWTLLFVGDGPLAPDLRRAAESRDVGEILSVPAVQPQEIAAYYAAARLLVFSSLGDPWGLVVNEALECGTPVLCSTLAGCADDLILPGKNGWLVDPTEPGELNRVLLEALRHPQLDRMSVCAMQTAGRFGPSVMADGILKAVRHAAATNSEHSGAAEPAR